MKPRKKPSHKLCRLMVTYPRKISRLSNGTLVVPPVDQLIKLAEIFRCQDLSNLYQEGVLGRKMKEAWVLYNCHHTQIGTAYASVGSSSFFRREEKEFSFCPEFISIFFIQSHRSEWTKKENLIYLKTKNNSSLEQAVWHVHR